MVGSCNLSVAGYSAPDHPRRGWPRHEYANPYCRSEKGDRHYDRTNYYAGRDQHHQKVQVFLDLHGFLR
jgi:hypothetical protein